MKQQLICAATLFTCVGATAQSSLQIFGNADAAITRGTGSIASRTSMTSGGMLAPRFGFSAVEDMGGGMKGGFYMEGVINWDNGSSVGTNTNNQVSGAALAPANATGLAFYRRASVSVGGSWGELRLGRDFVPSFWNLTYDPFNARGIGTAQTVVSGNSTNAPAGQRASNAVQYLYNHPFNALSSRGGSGFHADVMYFLGENASNAANSGDGTGFSTRVGYNIGDLSAAFAYAKTKYLTGDAIQSNIGASYRVGPTLISAHVARDRLGEVHGIGWLLGGAYVLGVHTLRASYSRYETDDGAHPRTAKLALGYIHNLSKRTAVYATIARANNTGGSARALGSALTAANSASSGYELGISHSF